MLVRNLLRQVNYFIVVLLLLNTDCVNALYANERPTSISQGDNKMIEKIKPPELSKEVVLVFDCFGVVFADRFKEFVEENKEKLEQYIETKEAPSNAKKLGYPSFYYYLAEQIDLNKITDAQFYGILSSASDLSPNAIQKVFNDINCLNENIIKLIIAFKNKGYKIALFANADRIFLQKFLNIDIQNLDLSDHYQKVGDLFDLVRTSSEVKKNKRSKEMIKNISSYFDVSEKQLIIIDDSENNVEFFKKTAGTNALYYKRDVNELFEGILSVSGSSLTLE